MKAGARTKKAGGCGCGGGSRPSGDCGCGCKGGAKAAANCTDCANTPVYQRPNFFEGQLLTEDDLQSLVQYTVDKNRLHNRHLWGDGVVCGLDASVDVCNPRIINIEPGYALDCCGNDLVLSCPAPVDIEAMIRDLRQRLGVDCGPDCPPVEIRGAGRPQDPIRGIREIDPAATPSLVFSPRNTLSQTPRPAEPAAPSTKKPTYRFSLYLRYCETSAEPVSPYTTGASCADISCQPTRIREGVRFELDCCKAPEPADDLFRRYCECLGEKNGESKWQHLDAWKAYADTTTKKIALFHAGSAIYSKPKLLEAVEAVKPLSGAGAAKRWKEKPAEAIETATGLLTEYARFYSLDPQTREALRAGDRQLFVSTQEALGAIGKTIEKIDLEPGSVEAEQLAALKEQTEVWKTFDGTLVPAEEPKRLMAAGVLPSDALWSPLARVVDRQRTELLRAVELDPATRNPILAARLRMPLAAVPEAAPAAANPAEPKFATLQSISRVSEDIKTHWGARATLLLECFCRNLNPPCPPCDDPRVLLATFAWENCEVVDLCMTVRKWVITPNNLRYWLPHIGAIGQLLERLCCGLVDCEPLDEKDYRAGYVEDVSQQVLLFYFMQALRECRTVRTPSKLSRYRLQSNPEGLLDMMRVERPLDAAAMLIGQRDDLARTFTEALERPELVELLRQKLELDKGARP